MTLRPAGASQTLNTPTWFQIGSKCVQIPYKITVSGVFNITGTGFLKKLLAFHQPMDFVASSQETSGGFSCQNITKTILGTSFLIILILIAISRISRSYWSYKSTYHESDQKNILCMFSTKKTHTPL